MLNSAVPVGRGIIYTYTGTSAFAVSIDLHVRRTLRIMGQQKTCSQLKTAPPVYSRPRERLLPHRNACLMAHSHRRRIHGRICKLVHELNHCIVPCGAIHTEFIHELQFIPQFVQELEKWLLQMNSHQVAEFVDELIRLRCG